MARMTKTQIEYLQTKLNGITRELVDKSTAKKDQKKLQDQINRFEKNNNLQTVIASGKLQAKTMQDALAKALGGDRYSCFRSIAEVIEKSSVYKSDVQTPLNKLNKRMEAVCARLNAYETKLRIETSHIMDKAVLDGSIIDLEQVTKALAAIK